MFDMYNLNIIYITFCFMFNTTSLEIEDKEIFDLIKKEDKRQLETIRLIPSENYASTAVIEAAGSSLMNKYSEGYSGKRYYEGQEFIDQIEDLAISRAKKLFKTDYHFNVQPYSGSPANLAALFALCSPGDTIMGLELSHGGHLTHGYKLSITGKIFKSVQYQVDKETNLLDYKEIRKIALENKPKVIIAGFTAYPRQFDFNEFRKIADEVGAFLMADISHISALVAGNVHSSPFGIADIITSTSHKSLGGPRGAFIACKAEFASKVDKAIIPGLQGGPHNSTTAAMAVAFKEADTEKFKKYAKQIITNSVALSEELIKLGYHLITNGSDNHLILIDMIKSKNISGKIASSVLIKANIECNANTVPFDERGPMDPSGIRLGTPAVTTIGMNEDDMKDIALFINEAIENYDDEYELEKIKENVTDFMKKFN